MTGPVWPDLLTVHVTEQDIAAGEQSACTRCPIALATRRALGLGEDDEGEWMATVLGAFINVYGRYDHDLIATWRPPESVALFINAFDAGQGVKPFTFAAERAA